MAFSASWTAICVMAVTRLRGGGPGGSVLALALSATSFHSVTTSAWAVIGVVSAKQVDRATAGASRLDEYFARRVFKQWIMSVLSRSLDVQRGRHPCDRCVRSIQTCVSQTRCDSALVGRRLLPRVSCSVLVRHVARQRGCDETRNLACETRWAATQPGGFVRCDPQHRGSTRSSVALSRRRLHRGPPLLTAVDRSQPIGPLSRPRLPTSKRFCPGECHDRSHAFRMPRRAAQVAAAGGERGCARFATRCPALPPLRKARSTGSASRARRSKCFWSRVRAATCSPSTTRNSRT